MGKRRGKQWMFAVARAMGTPAPEGGIIEPSPSKPAPGKSPSSRFAQSPRPHRPRPEFLEYLIVRTGGPLAIAGFGVGFMTAAYFWTGVLLLYSGLGLFALDIAYEEFFIVWPLKARIACGILFAVVIVIASKMWIFTPAPLSVFASSSVDNYSDGSELHGIKWLKRYSELNVQIKNESSVDYDNVDMQLSTDLVINHLVQTGGLGNCKIEGIHGVTEAPHWQHVNDSDQPDRPMDDPQWDYNVIPNDKNGNPMVPFMGADWAYRIRCDRIPANSSIALLAALVVVNPDMKHCSPPSQCSLF